MQRLELSISSLIDWYQRGELRLPEIQRQYVWESTRVRDLLDSLYRGYPSGSILIWETSEPIPQRQAAIEQLRTTLSTKLLLDGQQRLTSLTAALQGRMIEVKNRKRLIEIAFNLDHPEGVTALLTDVENDQALTSLSGEVDDAEETDVDAEDENDVADDLDGSRSRGNKDRTFAVATQMLLAQPNWISVKDVFGGTDDRTLLKKAGIKSLDDPLFDKYSDRLKRLRAIKDYQYVVHVLEQNMSYEEVTEIFVRVNSLGAKLRSSDLALAQMTSRWPDLLKELEAFQAECTKSWSAIELGQLVRAIVVFATHQSKFGPVGKTSVQALREGWRIAKQGLDYAINFMRSNAGIENQSLLSSAMFLHVLAAASQFEGGCFTESDQKLLLRWLLVGNARGRFGRGASEGLLNEDLSVIFDRKGLASLTANLERQFGRLSIEAVDLQRRGANSPMFSLAYMALKHFGAKDWYTKLGISLSHQGKSHLIQWHHIFPKALLKSRAVDAVEINEIANMAFIGGRTNQQIGKKDPLVYLNEIMDGGGTAILESQCIPLDPHLWSIANYGDFLAYRRAMLAERMNGFIAYKCD